MLSYDESYSIIKSELSHINLTQEKISHLKSSGRIISENLISDINLPPFNNSSMDGFCIKYADGICKWNIKGEISAGNFKNIELSENDCVGIMTGGRIPDSADTVIPVEDVSVTGNVVILNDDVKIKKGNDIRYLGEDIKMGEIIFKINHLIKSNDISLLAACGINNIPVYRKMKIGVLTSGDELVDIDKTPVDAQIRSSNLCSLVVQIEQVNAEPLNFGIVRDDVHEIKLKITEALNSGIDILVTSGGVSVGKYDFIKDVLQEIGAEIIFWKVNIKPGKPLLLSKYKLNERSILIFSLPGNPVSCYINFSGFIRRALNDIYGGPSEFFSAELSENIYKKDDKKHFIRAISSFDYKNKKTFVTKAGSQSSGNMGVLSRSDCVIIFDEDYRELRAGESVICMRI